MSKHFVGNNARVGSADMYLKRIVLGLSVVVVLLLAGLAISSIFNRTETQEPAAEVQPEVIDDDPNSPDIVFPGNRIEVGDLEFPLSISCVTGTGGGDVHLIVIENQGALNANYLVTAELVDNDGSSVDAMARVDELRAGERREVVLLADSLPNAASACTITGVQSDRRVLLNNG